MATDENVNYCEEYLSILFLKEFKNKIYNSWKIESCSNKKMVIISPLIDGMVGKIALSIKSEIILIEDIISMNGELLNNNTLQSILNSFLDNFICNIKDMSCFTYRWETNIFHVQPIINNYEI